MSPQDYGITSHIFALLTAEVDESFVWDWQGGSECSVGINSKAMSCALAAGVPGAWSPQN